MTPTRRSFLRSLLLAPFAASFMARSNLTTPKCGTTLKRVGAGEYVVSWDKGSGPDFSLSQTWERNADGTMTLIAQHVYPVR